MQLSKFEEAHNHLMLCDRSGRSRWQYMTGYPLMVLWATEVSGCSSMCLHSKTRQTQGDTAKKVWEEIDMTGAFTGERKHSERLRDAEKATQLRMALAMRDASAYLISPNAYLESPLVTIQSGLAEEISKELSKRIRNGRALNILLDDQFRQSAFLN
jgi:hypothetical protein